MTISRGQSRLSMKQRRTARGTPERRAQAPSAAWRRSNEIVPCRAWHEVTRLSQTDFVLVWIPGWISLETGRHTALFQVVSLSIWRIRSQLPARHFLGRYLDLHNGRRPHSSLDGAIPDLAYFTTLSLRAAV
jgi:hypothetical protein